MPMTLGKLFKRRLSGNKKVSSDVPNSKTSKTSKLLKRLGTRLTNKDSMGEDIDNNSWHTMKDESSQNHFDNHTVYEVVELNNSTSSFQEQFEQIKPSKKPRALVLQEFVATSTRQDIYALRDLLSDETLKWTKVQFKDNAPTSCRRWTYKKDNILHHTKELAKARDIALVFEASMAVIVEEMPSIDAVYDVLDQVDKDNDITLLSLTGSLDDRDTAQVFQVITNLLSKEDRVWDKVRIEISFGGNDPFQWQLWKQTIEEYAFLFSQLQIQYGCPIEVVRPWHHQQ